MSYSNERQTRSIDWWDIIFGVVLVIFGIVIMNNLLASYLGLAAVFGIVLIFRGAFTIYRGVRLREVSRIHSSRGILGIILGVLAIGFGIYLCFNPAVATVTLGYMAGIYLLATGIFNLINAFKLGRVGAVGLAVIQGILNVILIIMGVQLLGNWLVGGLTLASMLGIATIIAGIYAIVEGFTN